MTPRAPSEHQASPRPRPFALSIRTATIDTKEAPEAPVPTESQASLVTYPIPIPEKKVDKALEIWDQLRKAPLKDGLAQLPTAPSTTSYLSPTSIESSPYRKAESVSSINGDITERSSVMSFDEIENPLSAKKIKAEFTTYHGKKVTTRVRKPFDPKAKAKTALIRCLGSCASCRERNVACPLEHHDTDHLERLWLNRNSLSGNRPLHSSRTNSREKLSPSTRQRPTSGTRQGVSAALLGIGENFDSYAPDALDYTESPSPAGAYDPLAGIAIPVQPPYELSSQDLTPDTINNQHSSYQAYQNGAQFPLGVWRQGRFLCQYQDDKDCQHFFDNAEQLQTHFETAHFAFTRINPAHRYICSDPDCRYVSQDFINPCQCKKLHTAELWICGNFMRVGYNERYAPDGQSPLYGGIGSSRYTSSYGSASIGYGPGMGQDVNLYYNAGMNPGGQGFGGRSTYTESTGFSEDYNYAAQPPSGQHGNGRGYGFRRASHHITTYFTMATQRLYPKIRHAYRQHKLFLFFIVLLVSLTLGIEAKTHFLRKILAVIPSVASRLHLTLSVPTLGFVGVVVSFVTCWSAKHRMGERERERERERRSRPHRCPLHVFTPLANSGGAGRSFQCKQLAPDFIWGGCV